MTEEIINTNLILFIFEFESLRVSGHLFFIIFANTRKMSDKTKIIAVIHGTTEVENNETI